MTYGELRAAIADFLNRDDLTAKTPTFVALAHAQLNRRIRHWRGETNTTLALTGRYTDLPADYVEMTRIAAGRTLTLIDADRMQQLHEAGSSSGVQPYHYRLVGGQVEVFPASTAEVTISYYAAIPVLVADGDSNWLLNMAPDAYLYGSLMQTAPYLAEDARLQTWGALYEAALGEIDTDNRKARFGTKWVMQNA